MKKSQEKVEKVCPSPQQYLHLSSVPSYRVWCFLKHKQECGKCSHCSHRLLSRTSLSLRHRLVMGLMARLFSPPDMKLRRCSRATRTYFPGSYYYCALHNFSRERAGVSLCKHILNIPLLGIFPKEMF